MSERKIAYLLPDRLKVMVRGELDKNLNVCVGRITHWANYLNHSGALVSHEPLLPGSITEISQDGELNLSTEEIAV